MEKDLKQIYQQADSLKSRINSVRPLSERELEGLRQYFRVGLTYTSNALEGNSFTETETKVLLEDGLTAGGKPMRDAYETVGHADAYDYMTAIAIADDYQVTEYDIKELHRLFYRKVDESDAGVYRKEDVFITGTEFLPPIYQEVPERMKQMVQQVNSIRNDMHPIEWAARIHMGIVEVHPFVDGNGRTARLMMNLALIQKGFGIVIIPPVLRNDYITALKISQRKEKPDDTPFIRIVAQSVVETQKDYCRMFRIPVIDKKKDEHTR